MAKDTKVYYVDHTNFQEAMLTFAFRSKVDWLEEGMSIASWQYTKVASLDAVQLPDVVKYLHTWNGNPKSKVAGHRVVSVGDVIVVGSNAWMVLGRGWALIPNVLWKRVKKT